MYMDYEYPAFVPLHADSSCLFLLFGKWFVFVCFLLLFHHVFFSLAYWPFHTHLLACLIWAAILNSLFVCICLHPDVLSLVVLNSNLLYQVSYPVNTPTKKQKQKQTK